MGLNRFSSARMLRQQGSQISIGQNNGKLVNLINNQKSDFNSIDASNRILVLNQTRQGINPQKFGIIKSMILKDGTDESLANTMALLAFDIAKVLKIDPQEVARQGMCTYCWDNPDDRDPTILNLVTETMNRIRDVNTQKGSKKSINNRKSLQNRNITP